MKNHPSPQRQKKGPRRVSNSIISAVLLLLVITLTFSFLITPETSDTKISIDQLVTRINTGEVTRIVARGDALEVTFKDGSEAKARKEAEAGFSETLTNYGVNKTAFQSVAFEIEDPSGLRFWLSVLLPTLIPLIVIVAIFWFIFRQARSGANQAFSFGRSNIKLFSSFKEKVSFKDVAGLKEAKEELTEIVDFLQNPQKYLEIGARIPRGVLMTGPPGTGKCVAGDTLITTNKGLIEIQDIPRYFFVNPESAAVAGAKLPTLDIETLGQGSYPASHWYDLGEQETITITLKQGMELEGTPEHPVATMNEKGQLRFRPLAELKTGDLVAIKFNSGAFGSDRSVDPATAYTMGLLTGDGNLSHASRIGFTTTDPELAYAFRTYTAERYPDQHIGTASDGITQVISSWKMKRDFYRAGMSYLLSYDKIIPPSILQAPKETIVAFLQGLFDTDGSFERYSATFTTVSKKLSDQVVALLLNLGVMPKRRIKSRVGNDHPRPVYEIGISGTALTAFANTIGFRLVRKQEKLREYLAIHGAGNTNIDVFSNMTSFVEECFRALSAAKKSNEVIARIIDKTRQRKRISRQSLQKLISAYEASGLRTPTGEYLKSFLAAEIFFSPITAKKTGRARVYDFTVPKVHSFVANGTISHNTLLARAVAGEAGVPFFHISASEFVEMFVGVGAARTRDAFQTAKKAAPAILFIDEIDAVGRERGAGLGGGHDEREQTLNQILVEMDGFDREAQVIVIAATNRPDVLDKALLRPGRFDRRVFLDLPDIEDREAILKVHARGKQIAKNLDFRKVAVRTPGFSGADLANLINEAALLAAKHNRKEVAQDDLFNSIEKVLLGPERRGRVISEQEKKITAYHEAGHALVSASIKEADPVHKVSIVSRGHAGGYTLNLPVEEVRLKTRKQFLASLAMMMGGYASEKEVFGDISTGASNDLQQASRLARLLVTKFGMSEKIGPISYNGAGDAIFLGRELAMHKDHSEKVASEIDSEIRKLIHAAHRLAVSIIKKRRKALNAVAAALIEKESLEQEAFNEIIGRFKLKPLAV